MVTAPEPEPTWRRKSFAELSDDELADLIRRVAGGRPGEGFVSLADVARRRLLDLRAGDPRAGGRRGDRDPAAPEHGGPPPDGDPDGTPPAGDRPAAAPRPGGSARRGGLRNIGRLKFWSPV